MSVPNLPQNPCPRLDERAVEAAARELARMVSPPPCGTLESAADRTLAAYFAALDPDQVCVSIRREDAYALVLGPLDYTLERAGKGGSPLRARKAMAAALGLFTPDTEEPT